MVMLPDFRAIRLREMFTVFRLEEEGDRESFNILNSSLSLSGLRPKDCSLVARE